MFIRCLPHGSRRAVCSGPLLALQAGLVLLGLSGDVLAEEHPVPAVVQTDINFYPEDLEIQSDGDFHRLTLRDADLDRALDRLGDPQLPVLAKWLLLPPGQTVANVEITPVDRVAIPGRIRPVPIRDPEGEDVGTPDQPNWTEDVYPRETGGVVVTGQNRIYRLAKIGLYPLEYRPAEEQLSLLRTIRIRLVLRPLTTEEAAAELEFARPYAVDDPFGGTRNWVASTVVNSGDLPRYYPEYAVRSEKGSDDKSNPESNPEGGAFISEWPSPEGLAVPYVIITNDRDETGSSVGDMSAAFQAWADTLTAYGITAVVRTVDQIDDQGKYAGFDRPMRIRNFIHDAVNHWGTSYVLLGGDMSVVPSRRVGGPDQGGWSRPDPVADYWYSRIGLGAGGADLWALWNGDGDSWVGEGESDLQYDENVGVISSVKVGRIPARNAVEAQAIIYKTMRYLLFPSFASHAAGASFYQSATVAAGPTNDMSLTALINNAIVAAETFVIPSLTYTGSPWQLTRLYPNVAAAQDICDEPNPALGTCYTTLATYIDSKLAGAPYWEGNALQTTLGGSSHVLYHYEHSNRNELGSPSCPCNLPGCVRIGDLDRQTCPSLDPSDCCKALNDYLTGAIEALDLNQALALSGASGSQAKYSFVFSNGSWTNMIDMNSISEAFLRAPNGGAVAYLGNSMSSGGGTSASKLDTMFRKLFDTREPAKQWTQAWYETVDEEYSGGSWWDETRLLCQVPQLGDPILWPWRSVPQGITLFSAPSLFLAGLQSSITIMVDVADALVCLRQGDWTYVTGRTDANGMVIFSGVRIPHGSTPVKLTALKPGRKPSGWTIPVLPGKSVVYARHVIDDCINGGDCDSIPEAGERVAVDVTLENRGLQATIAGTVALRPLPAVTFELTVNGQYRPECILIGKGASTAPTEADTFTVPLVYRGTRAEGEPALPPSGETIRVWRIEGTGEYTVATRSSSASQDTVFSGVIRSAGGITDIVKTGEVSDTYVAGPDSIAFTFHGDRTEDRLTFRAEAGAWLTVNTGTTNVGALSAGDTTTIRFTTTVLASCPDRQNLYWTLAASEVGGATPHSYSDFVMTYAKPEVDLVSIDRDFDDSGCQDTTWIWRPTVWNRGSGAADSVTLRLRKTAGSMTVLDSVVTFMNLGGGSVASGGFFRLCGTSVADTAGFAATISKEVWHKSLFDLDITSPGGGGNGLPGPANVYADLAAGIVTLRWDPVAVGNGYRIEYATQPDAVAPTLLEIVNRAALRYDVVVELIAPGENGSAYDAPYYFWVSACNNQICGQRTRVGPVYPWVRERAGWPKLLSESSLCAPSVVWLADEQVNQPIIVAATDRLYAWKADGTPLNPAGPILYDPDLPRHPDQRFTEALAIGRWEDSDPDNLEIAGNMSRKGSYFVGIRRNGTGQCCEGQLLCSGPEFSLFSPMVADAQLGPDTMSPGVFLAGAQDGKIYSWDGDLNGVSNGVCGTQIFANKLADGSSYNYQSLAIGGDLVYEGEKWLVAISRSGTIARFSLDDLSGPITPDWERKATDRWLSTPAVGDVNGDGLKEIVVTTYWAGGTTEVDSVRVLQLTDGQPITNGAFGETLWTFRRGSKEVPPSGVALVDLNDDCDHEVIVAQMTAGGVAGAPGYPTALTLHVFDMLENGTVRHTTCTQTIPYNYRNDTSGHPNPASDVGAVYPIGTPVVADFDYDGTYKPDILIAASNGAIYAFEYSEPEEEGILTAKPGWPVLLPDVPREPVLCRLGETAQYSLVVQCQDDWLHVFDLPVDEDPVLGMDSWASYGSDGGNTRGRDALCAVNDRREPPGEERRPSIDRIAPNPSRGEVTLRLKTAGAEPIRIEVYDVTGRSVRVLDAGSAKAGSTSIAWDGRDASGHRLPSGVYWLVLRTPGGDDRRRMVVLR